jgi:hypothetical protein
MYSTANLSDVELKDQGNRMFAARKFEDAVNLYTKAIVSIPYNESHQCKLPKFLHTQLENLCVSHLDFWELCTFWPLFFFYVVGDFNPSDITACFPSTITHTCRVIMRQ